MESVPTQMRPSRISRARVCRPQAGATIRCSHVGASAPSTSALNRRNGVRCRGRHGMSISSSSTDRRVQCALTSSSARHRTSCRSATRRDFTSFVSRDHPQDAPARGSARTFGDACATQKLIRLARPLRRPRSLAQCSFRIEADGPDARFGECAAGLGPSRSEMVAGSGSLTPSIASRRSRH